MKILLDTDIGSDIDDAVCLAYLLARDDCELLGITTVTGEPVRRAMLADALCKRAGKNVPIYPGAESPLLIAGRQTEAPQADALAKWPYAQDYPHGEAVEFLRRTIRAHPGEITLLTIGPLTNIALLFAVDPEIPSLLKGVMSMAGAFVPPLGAQPEWNVLLDPHAAAMVARQTASQVSHQWVGLDVTTQAVMDAGAVRQRFSTYPLLAPVLDFAEVWFQKRPLLTFHDPLAAVALFDDAVCGFEPGTVEIELENPAGLTRWQRGAASRHTVATTVNPERFFEHYFGAF